jgi:hypothetical protein
MKMKILTTIFAGLCATSSLAENEFKFEAIEQPDASPMYSNFGNVDYNSAISYAEKQFKFQIVSDEEGGGSGAAEQPQYTQAQINEMINNPLGELWMLFLQHDMTVYEGDALDALGEDEKVFNTTQIMPVMSFQLTEDIKYIFRPVVPIHHWEVPTGFTTNDGNPPNPSLPPGNGNITGVDFESKTELGDIVLWNAFATNDMVKPPNIYGFGVTVMLDTATDDTFGTGKHSMGPMGLAVHVGDPGEFIYGAIVQHWWDVAGDDDRSDVNLTNIQYLGFYRVDDETNIGIGGPNITANWEADSDDRWTIPVGIAWNTTTKIGPLPVKIGVELYKYIESPDNFGQEWGLRFIFSPVVPKPGFSKNPWF